MLDFKKEYKDLCQPSAKLSIVAVPKMRFLAVSGKGNLNDDGGEYKATLGALCAVAYILKMNYKTNFETKSLIAPISKSHQNGRMTYVISFITWTKRLSYNK